MAYTVGQLNGIKKVCVLKTTNTMRPIAMLQILFVPTHLTGYQLGIFVSVKTNLSGHLDLYSKSFKCVHVFVNLFGDIVFALSRLRGIIWPWGIRS